ncbi:phosphatase 2C-like domain-containing protein [Rhodocollybia butyracea]|uniref:Phosphatase 2C-like domain-containing protein n=1 Tax=Rhodocollybia butyracea TaxID=206335 RepID=A0A9P5PDM7_9AGAR|nr:phosphatase 2C-like domain-containing protein [Rhodocollybia butyracea]
MFRHVLRHIHPSRTRKTLRTTVTVGVSTTLICFTSFAVAGRNNTIRCDSGLDDDEFTTRDTKSRKNGLIEQFRRPRWEEEEYQSADTTFASGPTWFPNKKSGIVRCDALIVPANMPSEDSITVYFPDNPDHEDDRRSYIALLDGHNGPAMSDFLCDHLVEYVAYALSQLPQQYEPTGFFDHDDAHTPAASSSSPSAPIPDQTFVNDTIKQAFKDIDDAMIDVSDVLSSPSNSNSKTNAVRSLRYAHTGSCALLSIYESDTKLLRVALTGDSRAVLGRKVRSDPKDSNNSNNYGNSDSNGYTYQVHVLSADQNGYNAKEVERLAREHPGEKVVEKGRVMGWGMARAFGDAAYKWSVDVQRQLHERYLGDRVRENMKTPPYLTAEPEITTTRIRKGDFLIMASDGLWDCLTSDEAVGLVGLWLQTNASAVYTNTPMRDFPPGGLRPIGVLSPSPVSPYPSASQSPSQSPSQSESQSDSQTTLTATITIPKDTTTSQPTSTPQSHHQSQEPKTYSRSQLPLSKKLQNNGTDDTTPMYPWWHTPKQFVLTPKDFSAAAHLASNALGGADKDLTEALISLVPPRARRYRIYKI